MRPDRKKEKTLFFPGGSPNPQGPPSASLVGKLDKPSFHAVPPPPTLYGSFEKVKAAASLSGNISDGEKKSRRRPMRKSRQVADSSAYNDVIFSDGKCDENGRTSLALPKSMEPTTSCTTSPSPSAMPNPSFKTKSITSTFTGLLVRGTSTAEPDKRDAGNVAPDATKISERDDRILLLTKSSTVSLSSNTDTLATADVLGTPKARTTVSLSVNLDATSAVELGIPRVRTPSIGVPKSRGKDLSKSAKCQAGAIAKKAGSAGADQKQGAQKGWRVCPSTLATSSSTGNLEAQSGVLSVDKPGSILSSVNCDGGISLNAHSWPGSSTLGTSGKLGSTGIFKVSNGTTCNGQNSSKSYPFSEQWSSQEAEAAVEGGRVLKGVLRVNPHYRCEAYVTVEGVAIDVLIDGLTSQNRAMEGDVVAVELNPVSFWPRLRGSNKQLTSIIGSEDACIKTGFQSEDDWRSQVPTVCAEYDDILSRSSAPGGNTWATNLHPDLEESNCILEWTGDLSSSPEPNLIEGSSSDSEMNGKRNRIVKSQGVSTMDCVSMANTQVSGAHVLSSFEDVVAKIASMPSKRPTGKVIAILEKSMRREAVVGFLEVQGSSNGGRFANGNSDGSLLKNGKKVSARNGACTILFVPVDSRFPKMTVNGGDMPEHLCKRLREGDSTLSSELVVARVEEWRVDSALPRGLVKQSLGPGGTIEAQTAAILSENAIHKAEFPESCLACLPQVPWNIPIEEEKKRKDLRNMRIFTIDPPTARDLDDALSVERLDDGLFRVGVHIADVSFFVQPDTALDKEAQNRSTSVYLIQTVLPMLPPLLCEELCSLNPGVERLAFSVIWTMDSSGNVVDQWIGKTIIRSCAKLTYGRAQEMIDGKFLACGEVVEPSIFESPEPTLFGDHKWSDVVADVKALHELSQIRRGSRFDGGALKLESSKLVFSLDDEGEPCDSVLYQHQDSNFLVEEFMLLANMTVAKVISGAFPDRALLRRHPEPSERKMKEFQDFCDKNGFQPDTSSSGALHLALETMRESFQDDPVLFNIVMLYATKPMQLARYFCTGDLKGKEDDWAHYALAVPQYTHFTSPIRRYPDLVVHRTLAAALEAEKVLSKHAVVCDKGEGVYRCFTGLNIDRKCTASESAQDTLTLAAKNHRIPEVAELSLVAAHCNERRSACRNVKESCDKLYLWSMVKKKQGILSTARVLALGPKFMSLYIAKIGMERRIYYDEIEGLNTEWFEATGTLVLSLSSDKVPFRKPGAGRGRQHRTVADVALLVNPTDPIFSNAEQETFEDLIREVEDRLAGKIIEEDDGGARENVEEASEVPVEPAVLPLTLRGFSSLPVSIHAVGGGGRPLDIAVRLYVSSYST